MPLNDNFIYMPPQEPLEILYEDDDLVVVNKPAGLLSVMGRLPEHQDSAYLRVLEKYPAAKVTHRLDMATSGLLMFAKHREAEVAVSKMFQARTVKKYYVALVQGQIQAEGSVEVPLITDWENRPRQMVHFELGKSAKTLFQLMDYDGPGQSDYMCGGTFTLAQLEDNGGRESDLIVKTKKGKNKGSSSSEPNL